MHDLTHATLDRQSSALFAAIGRNPLITALLDLVPALRLPDWYLGAGAITQTVWNQLHGYEPTNGIKDYDVVYFDPSRDDDDADRRVARELATALEISVDVTNEAYVHTWYPRHFGRSIPPYVSTEHAISTWPTTASCIGIRPNQFGAFDICAPYGLADLWGMVVRPNKAIVSREVYEAKTARWLQLWPELQVHAW